MNLNRLSYIAATILGLTLLVAPYSFSQSAKKRTVRTIPCPPVIGDKREAVLHNTKQRRQQPYQCFRTQKDAVIAGYKTSTAANIFNYTGWYRLRLNQTKDTCSSIRVPGTLVLFLQMRENPDGIFASFCPSNLDMHGSRTGYGATASGVEHVTIDPESTVCPDGNVQQTKLVQVTQSLSGSAAFSVIYKVVHVCLSPAYRGITCSREYTGNGFAEATDGAANQVHTWPSVEENVLDLNLGCLEASKRCKNCHPGLE